MTICMLGTDEELGVTVYECVHPEWFCDACIDQWNTLTAGCHVQCDHLNAPLTFGQQPDRCAKKLCRVHATHDARWGDLCPEHAP